MKSKTNMLRIVAVILGIILVTPLYAWETTATEESSINSNSILTASLRNGNNNLLHALILIPPLESSLRIEPGRLYIQNGIEYASGNFVKETNTWLLDYNASLIETFVDFRYSISHGLELKAEVTGGKLAEGNRDLLLFEGNYGYLQGERSSGLSDLVLGIKWGLRESYDADEDISYTNSALGLWYKKPLADEEDLLSSGGKDWAIAYLETDQLDEETFLHTQIGYTSVGDEEVFRKDIKTSNTFFYGMGLSWHCIKELTLIGQVQGNTNAFKAIKALTQPPLSVQGGFRYSATGRFFTEGSIGFGLNKESADVTMMFSLGMLFD